MGFLFEAPQPPQRHIWKVSELAAELRAQVEGEFSDLWIEGEISDLRKAASGHIYFTIKDETAQFSAVLFRRQASLLRFRPEDGLHILLRGKLSVYEQRGQVQLIAEHLEPVGAGSLQLAFEQVKQKLQDEGLFDAERKRALPLFPKCVGVVTSPSGAVIRDIINVVTRRHAALELLVYPAIVQGESAAASVAAGIAYFNQSREVDLIVIARGGGSLEDLAPFNSESLARVIANSELPVVSAVGHETDFTIADFVSDLRAPTPSAAAELITGAQHRVEERIELLSQRLHRAARYAVMQGRERFARLSVEAALTRMQSGIRQRQQRLDELAFRMETSWQRRAQTSMQRLQQLSASLMRHDVSHQLRFTRNRLETLSTAMLRAQSLDMTTRRNRIESLERQLLSLSPLGVLQRGYALVYDQQGNLLRSTAGLQQGQQLTTRLSDGSFESRVSTSSTERNDS
ncbi:exodeoxyribonuclease VII large subunit [Silvibacterium acidisoli]|uniref:exodeoxyribonuclease VII large subunit n=1 Tax=Acidobacteriaceae bacterium ZG23-2 TaxID=2883246 RepID=UPI00406D37E7